MIIITYIIKIYTFYIIHSEHIMLPPMLVECRLGLGHVMAHFALELWLLDMSLGVRQDSALVFVSKSTKTGPAVISFLCEITDISTNIRQFESLHPEMFLLPLLAWKRHWMKVYGREVRPSSSLNQDVNFLYFPLRRVALWAART